MSGLPAVRGIFGKAAVQHVCQRLRDVLQRRRLFVEDRSGEFRRALTAERSIAAEHFIKHQAESKDIGALIRLASRNLFGSHIAGCSDDDVASGDRRGCAVGGILSHLRQPEV